MVGYWPSSFLRVYDEMKKRFDRIVLSLHSGQNVYFLHFRFRSKRIGLITPGFSEKISETEPGTHFSKAPETFEPVKPFLVQ